MGGGGKRIYKNKNKEKLNLGGKII